MLDNNTPLWQLTIGQFVELTNSNKSNIEIVQPSKQKNLIYGLTGLCSLLSCSRPTAQRLKDSGKLEYQQFGRKIIFDADAVLKALGKEKEA